MKDRQTDRKNITHIESALTLSFTFANLPGSSRFRWHPMSFIKTFLLAPASINSPFLWTLEYLSSHQDVAEGYSLNTFSIVCCFLSPLILFNLLEYAFLDSRIVLYSLTVTRSLVLDLNVNCIHLKYTLSNANLKAFNNCLMFWVIHIYIHSFNIFWVSIMSKTMWYCGG